MTPPQEFVERFNVKEIGEFYGATEGNIAFWNYWGRGEPHGAIGATMLVRTFYFVSREGE
jgi:hypothetical protein